MTIAGPAASSHLKWLSGGVRKVWLRAELYYIYHFRGRQRGQSQLAIGMFE